MDTPSTPAPRRARHLIDPANPPARQPAGMSIGTVQRWVMSILAVTTIAHLSVGLVVAALYVDSSRPDAQIGLNVIAGAFGVIAVASGFLIHQRSALTPWLLVGLVPAGVGIFLTLR